MEGARFHGEPYRLGPRVPLQPRDAMGNPTQVLGFDIPTKVFARGSASSTNCDPGNSNLCEKPAAGQDMRLPIALGVAIPVTLAIAVLLYLHMRVVKKQKREDMMDPHKSLDFGLVMDPTKGGKSKRKSAFFGAEKDSTNPRHRQLSMDMNLSSPYLLPPGLQSSRESLHSLARTLHQNEDPYRPVAQYAASDVGSMRSFRKEEREGSSIYTGSSGGRDPVANRTARSPPAAALLPPPRQNSLPKTPSPAPDSFPTRVDKPAPELPMPTPPPAAKEHFVPLEPTIPVIETVPYPDDEATAGAGGMPVPIIQEPPPVAQKIPRKGLSSPKSQEIPPSLTQPSVSESGTEDLFIYDKPSAGIYQERAAPTQSDSSSAIGLGVMNARSPEDESVHMSPPNEHPHDGSFYFHDTPAPAAPFSAPIVAEPQEYYDDYYQQHAQEGSHDQHDYDDRGRSLHRRQSSEYPQDVGQAGLGLPQFDTRRLSVGFRPLPPDEMMDTEDPETRANRIRSFYKEYFEESRADPMPGHQQYGAQHGGPQYYEDYGPNYLGGEAAFFDPETNTFVMPYSQPVARRAMTPPPSGSRFPGPRAPRNFHGSVGGMSLPGGRGPPRPGSSSSSRMGPRPGSSASGRWGPRAGSSMSNMSSRQGRPRKPMAPPPELTTLPTPSKLKDDSFALLGAIDFAPPPTFRDQAAGRPQSPLGERRPYQLKVPASSPLVSSFEEMPGLPSPHLLRKSGTFTGLDFAPPRKFKDADTMSDAGSIRSNRSGISAVQQQAIRNGAGRVSRLPGDTVFTQAALSQTLKPAWDMRT